MLTSFPPTWSELTSKIAQSEGGIVKLAPATDFEPIDSHPVHRCWISLRGSVREQSLIFGSSMLESDRLSSVIYDTDRSAWIVTTSGKAHCYATRIASDTYATSAEPMQFMVDPDASIRAAGMTASFANEYGLSVLGEPSGFLTADEENFPEKFARIQSVFWSGSMDDRKLRKALRHNDCYPETIKVRGANFDPAVLFKRYRKCGSKPVNSLDRQN